VPLIALWADIRPSRIASMRSDRCTVQAANATVAQLAVLDPNEPGASLRAYRGPSAARNRSWIFSG
jgi:hypothetical protein